jgi:hypothetical protein
VPQHQTRYCRTCGGRLARDNPSRHCGPCSQHAATLSLPPDLPPDFWDANPMPAALASWHIGQVIRAYRHHPYHGPRPLPQELVGGWLGLTQAQLSRVEGGPAITDLSKLVPWAKILKIPSQRLWFKLPDAPSETEDALPAAPPAGVGDQTSVPQPAPRAPGGILLPVVVNGYPVLMPLNATTVAASGLGVLFDEWTSSVAPTSSVASAVEWKTMRDAMERRRLLQWAATGLGAGALGYSAEPVRQLLDLVLTGEQRSLEDWEITCADHLHAIRTRPPAQVRDDLVVDLLAVQRQLEMTPTSHDTNELRRITAMLAMIHANALTRLGEHGPAIRWWRTARDAANASTDLDLRLLVRAEEAGFGLYGQRDPQTVLTLTEQAQRIAGPRPSVGLANVASTQAKALSLLGRHADARRTLNTLITLSEADFPGQGPSFWTMDQIHFAESWVYAASGDEAATARAQDDIVKFPLDYQYQVNIQLHQALCTVVKGGVEQGVQQAVTVLHALPAAYQSNMITETGRMVLRTVPLDRQERPAVTELREVLAITPASTD